MRKVVYLLAGVLILVALSGTHATTSRVGEEERLAVLVHSSTGEEQAMALRELAFLRERLNKIPEAIDAWGYLKRTHGGEIAFSDSAAPPQTYARQADFHITRLRHVQNLRANPPQAPSAELRKKLSRDQNRARASLHGNAGYVHLMLPVDMDGDLVPEVFTVIGERKKLGERADMLLLVHKWDGRQYKEVFRWTSPDYQLGWTDQPIFDIHDFRSHGMYEIWIGFEPESDNVASLVSNGSEIRMQ